MVMELRTSHVNLASAFAYETPLVPLYIPPQLWCVYVCIVDLGVVKPDSASAFIKFLSWLSSLMTLKPLLVHQTTSVKRREAAF